MQNPPANFNFRYFESLPENKKVSTAKEFLERKFPPGSPLRDVTRELTDAGATCQRGKDLKGRVYYGCMYNKSGFGLTAMFVTTEWKIIIYPDTSETEVLQILVGRGLTGL